MSCHLNRDVRRRSESVKREATSAFDSRQAQRTKSDDAGAQKRCGLLIDKCFRDPVDEVLGFSGVFPISAVDRISGKRGMVAEVFHSRTAKLARLIRAVQPGDAGLRFLGTQFAERQAHSAGNATGRRDTEEEQPSSPSVVLVRAGARGLEVMISPPSSDSPPGWEVIDDGAVWVLAPDISLDDLEGRAYGSWPLLPALVTVGSTVDGAVLANLEHAGSLAVE